MTVHNPIPAPEHQPEQPPPPRQPVSIKDVAARAGVSTATVSRVVNNHGIVRPDTAERVLAVIDELGYRPNRLARGLSTRRSMLLGMAVPDLQGDYYASLVTEADAAARARGYHLIVTSHAHAEGPGLTPDIVDGAIVMITEDDEHGTFAERLLDMDMPVVVLGTGLTTPRLPHVQVDNRVGTRQAVRHLLEATPPDRLVYVGGQSTNTDARSRAIAFAEVLRSVGHEPRPDQIVYGRYAVEHGAAWASEARARGRLRGAGVLAGNDEIAVGIVNESRDHGLSLPDDLRVVGFDDGRICRLIRPSLSSVRTPLAELSRRAVDLLVWRLDGEPDADVGGTVIELATELVVRESSRPRDAGGPRA